MRAGESAKKPHNSICHRMTVLEASSEGEIHTQSHTHVHTHKHMCAIGMEGILFYAVVPAHNTQGKSHGYEIHIKPGMFSMFTSTQTHGCFCDSVH